MFRIASVFIVFIMVSFTSSLLAAESLPEVKLVVLSELIDEALKNNPEVASAYEKWQAAQYKTKEAGGLPDPQLKYTYFGESIETKVGPQEHKYGASQKLPFPGKLSLKGKAQAKQADALREEYEVLRCELIKNIKFLYYDIFWVEEAIRIIEEEKSLLESFEKVAQRKYESNLIPQQDVIKAQVEISRLIDRLFLLRQNHYSLLARMNSLLNRPRGSTLGFIGALEPETFGYQLEELHEISGESSQQLLIRRLQVERAEYEKSLAELNYLPDFTLGFDYIEVGGGQTTDPNDGEDAWMASVAINLPLWFSRLRAQTKEKEALLDANKKSYQSVENDIVYEVEDLYFKVTTYRDIIGLYKNALVPQTEQAFAAARTGYETGSIDFLDWLDSERTVLQTKLAYQKAVVDYMKSLAYLERVVGKEL